jgi:hypothetical protein
MPANKTDEPRQIRTLSAPEMDTVFWLLETGLIERKEGGDWKLTELGEKAMARFDRDMHHFVAAPDLDGGSRLCC